ncbi:hypothetical protein FS837_012474 [Tulasnella sp. UAMH 9824]|nr:hypothetical protein FS837_012474 [Tulasnella sp. UAMH 9824]
MSDTSIPKFIVQHPFDAESDGDCILRTCDGAEFKASKAVLSLASSIFHDMFALPPVASEGKDQTEIPVVPIEEDAPTLQALLQMIYPIDPPQIASFPLVQRLVIACDKYFISTAKLQLHLRDALNDDHFFEEDPLACYAFFWKLGWEKQAIEASRYMHAFQLTENSIAKMLINKSGDVEALLQLSRSSTYRERHSQVFRHNRSLDLDLPLIINRDYMSSQTLASTSYTVKAPFDASSIGDCFLRSSDGAHFKTSRVILSIASPFFRDMFALPQPGDEASSTTSELPTIPVEEDAQTLQTFLTMLYPLDPPVVRSYTVATKLVRACDKYLISPLRLKSCLRDILATPEALKSDPLGVYALAWRLGLEEEAKTASRYTHRIDLRKPAVKQDLITRSGSVEALLALWDMRLRREEQLDRITNAVQLGGPMGCDASRTYSGRHHDNSSNARAFGDCKASAKLSLLEPYPEEACCVEKIESFFGWTAGTGERDCTNCKLKRDLELRQNASRVLEQLKIYPQTIAGWVLSFAAAFAANHSDDL